ncbi:MAG: hypothetical protein GY847_19380 [Proteobacteria bacterium]|nr:hypothetical protein [Pseudomonadota bacterium]
MKNKKRVSPVIISSLSLIVFLAVLLASISWPSKECCVPQEANAYEVSSSEKSIIPQLPHEKDRDLPDEWVWKIKPINFDHMYRSKR